MPGEKPPEVKIEIENKTYETIRGTYCWNGTCADTGGPRKLLKGKEPIRVNPVEKVSFNIDYKPKPNKFTLVQISESDEEEVSIIEKSFSAPSQKGTYYYSYGIWWEDKEKEDLFHGDAFYAFALEVG
ncbi:hypothetical protein H0266_08110 [Halobacillus locisalis]|uniref:Uncharacterized protein n=1 Tax=Halobacillus locisalis TaxID=220753 RepID=A0A838CSD4_9BACI|nr:hypothetical protein [Halobacillus locisalis]MBA2174854.1 hypothetical protein [Halobacillus locisalis]